MDEAKWYVIATMSAYENKVATNLEKIVENRGLQDWIHKVHIPTETVVEVKDNQRKEVERKLFPGYVFVKMVMTDESWFVVRNVRGCTGFVGPNGKPVPLTEKEIASFGVERKEIVVDYVVGDTVMIVDGPLENFSGLVEEIDTDNNMVRIKTSMFGREQSVELELDQVERMD
ncbi:MAG: transcription termination/antitermination factor NusG [Ruminococcaceae bacterium]|nr:transcription termination/antitermination factor NusG [Oscillospiraceae bacterium]MBE6807435.1 transcription termination/antitermination factor NusG [Oscillospiraceae bacterium]